jgi:anti-sigma-K factor RskA
MTVRDRRRRDNGDDENGLSGWKLVAALAVIATVAIATLVITGSAEAVTIAVLPLLLVLGISATR